MLVFSKFTGAMHVVADIGALIVGMCHRSPQTVDALLNIVYDVYEAEHPEELASATINALNQLYTLGILKQCTPP